MFRKKSEAAAMKRIFSDGFFERTEIFLGRKDSTKKQIYDKNAIGMKVAYMCLYYYLIEKKLGTIGQN